MSRKIIPNQKNPMTRSSPAGLRAPPGGADKLYKMFLLSVWPPNAISQAIHVEPSLGLRVFRQFRRIFAEFPQQCRQQASNNTASIFNCTRQNQFSLTRILYIAPSCVKSRCLWAYIWGFLRCFRSIFVKISKSLLIFIDNCAEQPLEWGCAAAAHSGCVRRAWEFVEDPSCCFNIIFALDRDFCWFGISRVTNISISTADGKS